MSLPMPLSHVLSILLLMLFSVVVVADAVATSSFNTDDDDDIIIIIIAKMPYCNYCRSPFFSRNAGTSKCHCAAYHHDSLPLTLLGTTLLVDYSVIAFASTFAVHAAMTTLWLPV